MPISTPKRLWSHLALNFLMDLPESEKCSNIQTMDSFSELIALLALPTAFKTDKLLFHYFFQYYILLEDIVSDQSSQFI